MHNIIPLNIYIYIYIDITSFTPFLPRAGPPTPDFPSFVLLLLFPQISRFLANSIIPIYSGKLCIITNLGNLANIGCIIVGNCV